MNPSFQPTAKRVNIVDALRGLALFGILLANIPFADPGHFQTTRKIMLGSQRCDEILQIATSVFIDKKFITIFSILFGFGFYIQMKRAEANGIAFRYYFLRRMLLLLLIGTIHAYVFWYGDILRHYAIGGMFLLLVYKWPSRKILIMAVTFAIFLTAAVFIINGSMMPPYSYDTGIINELPVTPSYWRYLQINFTVDPVKNFMHDSTITLVFTFGNMLIGFWMAKSGFFHQPGRFRSVTTKIILLGSTFGIGCSYIYWLLFTGKIDLAPALIWLPFVVVLGLILQSLFYISAFIKLFQHPGINKFLSVFIPVGRMALTNYLLQTVFYTLFFFYYAHGLQLYGKVSRCETYLIAVILFCLQVMFSNWWLKRHQQGPVEDIWKRFSYQFARRTN